eukprot:SAG11_NODE_7668_length_1112_cov_4.372162_1_plen_244_part_10
MSTPLAEAKAALLPSQQDILRTGLGAGLDSETIRRQLDDAADKHYQITGQHAPRLDTTDISKVAQTTRVPAATTLSAALEVLATRQTVDPSLQYRVQGYETFAVAANADDLTTADVRGLAADVASTVSSSFNVLCFLFPTALEYLHTTDNVVISWDTTHGTNSSGYPLAFLTTLDEHTMIRTLAVFILSGETRDNVTWCMRTILEWAPNASLQFLLDGHVTTIEVLDELNLEWALCQWHLAQNL